MDNELISVVVPVYNVENYLERCINSIRSQTYTNIEIILVDDGSTDKSSMICDKYAQIDNRIVIIHKENGGLSDARNCGIDKAVGKYLLFVDSDDYIDSNMLMNMYQNIIQTRSDMVICNISNVNEDGSCIHELDIKSPIKREVVSDDEMLRKIMCVNGWYYVVAWNKLYRAEIFSDLKYKVGKIHEDEFIIHHLISKCKRISVLEERYYFYVQRNNSITHNKDATAYLHKMEALADRVDFLFDSHIDYSYEMIYILCVYASIFSSIVGNRLLNIDDTQMTNFKRLYKEKFKKISPRIIVDWRNIKLIVKANLFYFNADIYCKLWRIFKKVK